MALSSGNVGDQRMRRTQIAVTLMDLSNPMQ